MHTLFLFAALLQAQYEPPPGVAIDESELRQIRTKMTELKSELGKLPMSNTDLYADVAICYKAAHWIMRHPEEFYVKTYAESTRKALDLGMARARELSAGKPSWTTRKGRVARAYRSKLEGSFQPYIVIVPDDYTGQPIRLDVVLHGRAARITEASFVADAEFGKPVAASAGRIELHVFGRTNNAYRWAGESDVFEALAAVKRNYKIDESRILLRGFSMGGAGGWHVGLHYPTEWAGIEAGAGFTETLRYAKQESAPEVERRTWTIYDAYLYARNTQLVPTVGYGSIDDPQLQASVNVKEQLAKESGVPPDLRALFLVGPKIGHKFAPESKQISEEFLAKAMPRVEPKHVNFLTYTTRYGKAAWIGIDGMERQFDRAEVDATRDGSTVTVSTKNVTHLSFATPMKATVDGQKVKSAASALRKVGGQWQADSSDKALRKRHGLQGPIDDAFLDSFLCVKPTGTARDTAAQQVAMERLTTFQKNWDKYLRGDVRVKDDTSISEEDIRSNNLILFGDEGSNKLIAKVLKKLPVSWKQDAIEVSGKKYPGSGQLLVAIYPNPLNPEKYIVLNSGHTFSEKDLRGTNALLFPRLGDWAVLKSDGSVAGAGFFDESWH